MFWPPQPAPTMPSLVQPQQPSDLAINLTLWATWVPHGAGAALQAALRAGRAAWLSWPAEREVPGYLLAVDADGRIAEAGWLKLPTLAHVAWAAQYLDFRRRQARQVAHQNSQGALTVPIFKGQVCRNQLCLIWEPLGHGAGGGQPGSLGAHGHLAALLERFYLIPWPNTVLRLPGVLAWCCTRR